MRPLDDCGHCVVKCKGCMYAGTKPAPAASCPKSRQPGEDLMKYNKGAIMRSIDQPNIRDDHPVFDTGDTIRVNYRVVEGTRTRIQGFEGVVIARKNGNGASATMTVRKVSSGEGVERIFPVNSPLINDIEIVKRGRSRRAKLYYLRELRGKAARLKTDIGRQEADRAIAKAEREARTNSKNAKAAAEDAPANE